MSDFYEVLRRRVETVAAKAQLGAERLQAAQDAKGFSNERLAHRLNISEKTWRRWKKSGEVPVYHLDLVVKTLGLEVERDGDAPTHEGEAEVAAALRLLRDELRATRADLGERLTRLEGLVAP